jgi:class 3 adenylate cyclase
VDRDPRRLAGLAVAAGRDVRDVSHGALRVWQTLSEGLGRGRGDRDLAVLFCDLVDFSSFALRAGDEATLELVQDVTHELESAVLDHRGHVVKHLGDGLMADFDHPRDALQAALAGRERLGRVTGADGWVPRLRAGVHWGRPRRMAGDLLGVDVNVAARAQGFAKPGQVLATDPACALLAPGEFDLGRARRLRAKGTPPGLRVREVRRPER